MSDRPGSRDACASKKRISLPQWLAKASLTLNIIPTELVVECFLLCLLWNVILQGRFNRTVSPKPRRTGMSESYSIFSVRYSIPHNHGLCCAFLSFSCCAFLSPPPVGFSVFPCLCFHPPRCIFPIPSPLCNSVLGIQELLEGPLIFLH